MSKLEFINPVQPGTVSVIIPAYNRKDYIRQTVDSVLEQSCAPLELLVVDDGSTDGTLEILQSYGDKIRLLQHPNGENKGQAAALNLGLKHLCGEFIAILDSDDYWSEDFLEKMLPFIQERPECGMVYSSGFAVDEKGNKLYNLFPKNHQEHNRLGDILLDCYLCLPGESLVRRQVYEKVGGFDESLRAGQDHDMCIRLAENTKLAYNNQQLFHYRKHPDTISKKGLSTRWRNGFIILNRAINRTAYPKHVISKRKAVLNYRLSQSLKADGAVLHSLFRLFLAACYDPARALRVLRKQEVNH